MMKIAKCPHCWSQPQKDNPDFCYPVTRKDDKGNQIWRAGCDEASGGCTAEVLGKTAKEAIENWNIRPTIFTKMFTFFQDML